MTKHYKTLRLAILAVSLLVLGCIDGFSQTQIPMPAHSGSYTGYARGFYFITPIDMVISHLKAPTNASSNTHQAFEILEYSGTTISGTPTQLGYWKGVAPTDSVDTSIFIAKGTLIGIVGHRYDNSNITNFTAINSYTATGTHTANIDGNTVSLGRFGFQDNLGRVASNGSNLINGATGQLGRVLVYWHHPSNNKDIQAIAIDSPANNCGLSKAEAIKLKFRNAGIDLSSGDTINLSYKVGSGSTVSETLILSSALTRGAEMSHTFSTKHDFSTVGTYNVLATASAKNDSLTSNDTLLKAIIHAKVVSKFPYSVDWENGADGWFAEKSRGDMDWELGSPKKSTLKSAHSGSNVWGTGLDSNYLNGTDITLNSPCFDLTKVNKPSLSVWIRMQTEKDVDGMVLERSIDGGNNWIRVDTFIQSGFYNNREASLVLGPPMWSGDNNGWRLYTTQDTSAGKQSSVRYRFRFATSGSDNDEGVLIDDFKLQEAPKADVGVVGIANPTAGLCGSSTQNIAVLIKNFGTEAQDSIPVKVSTSGTIVDTFFSTLASGATDTLFMSATINTSIGGNFAITAYTEYTVDKENFNDTLMTTVSLIAIPNAPQGAAGQRCGSGLVTCYASTTGSTITWYREASGGSAIAFGDTVQLHIARTDTFYAQAGQGLRMPIKISEIDIGAPDFVEVQNLSTTPFDATGYYVLVSDNYTNINTVNANAWALGQFTAGQVQYKTDDANDNYWGSNLFFDPSGTGWAMIVDASGNVYDYVAWGWGASDIANQSVSFTIGSTSNNYNASSIWTGTAAAVCSSGTLSRFGNKDNDDNTDWTCTTASKGTMNANLSSFSGCPSSRTPIIATMLPSPVGMKVNQLSPILGLFGDGTIADPDTICVYDTLNFEITAPRDFTNSEFGTKWTIGNISTLDSLGNKPSNITYTTPSSSGNATVQMVTDTTDVGRMYRLSMVVTATSSKCDTTIYRYIYVMNKPNAAFATSNACLGDAVGFTNNSTSSVGAVTYKWNFGDGNSATNKNPFHLYMAEGTYTVSLQTRSNIGGCLSFAYDTVKISPIPKPNFSIDGQCVGSTVNFYDSTTISTGTITTYDWKLRDGGTASTKNASHVYTNAGTYNIRLDVTSDNGCSAGVAITTTILDGPTAAFSTNNECVTDTFAFTNNSTFSGTGSLNYEWDFGDNNTSTTNSPTHVYSNYGQYIVNLIATSANGCSDTSTLQVSAHPNPTANFTFSNQCLGDTTKFINASTIAAGSITSYVWEIGTATSTNTNYNLVLSNAGITNAKLTAISDNGCVGIANKSVEIHSLPTASFTTNDVCASEMAAFTNASTSNSTSLSYNWNFGDGNSSTDKDPNHQYSTHGIYTVELTATTAEGCEHIARKDLNVFAVPVSAFAASNVCVGENFSPTNNSTGQTGDNLTYGWDFGNGNKSNAKNPTISYSNSGTYTVELTVSTQNSCKSSVDTSITVYELPDASFATSNMGKGRYGFAPTDGDLASYLWDFGDGNSSTDKAPEHKYDAEGKNTVRLTTTSSDGCQNSETFVLDVTTSIKDPEAQFGLNAYPNPFEKNITIGYELPSKAHVVLEVYDATGKRVASLVQAEQTPGDYTYNFTSQLSNGMFLVRLSVDGKMQVHQIIQN
ncbi:MAG: PKD domain-containing protein [Bacteroidetes bacterium]|nr:PKD domain-containing protein [Bacteroidota bacterium]